MVRCMKLVGHQTNDSLVRRAQEILNHGVMWDVGSEGKSDKFAGLQCKSDGGVKKVVSFYVTGPVERPSLLEKEKKIYNV